MNFKNKKTIIILSIILLFTIAISAVLYLNHKQQVSQEEQKIPQYFSSLNDKTKTIDQIDYLNSIKDKKFKNKDNQKKFDQKLQQENEIIVHNINNDYTLKSSELEIVDNSNTILTTLNDNKNTITNRISLSKTSFNNSQLKEIKEIFTRFDKDIENLKEKAEQKETKEKELEEEFDRIPKEIQGTWYTYDNDKQIKTLKIGSNTITSEIGQDKSTTEIHDESEKTSEDLKAIKAYESGNSDEFQKHLEPNHERWQTGYTTIEDGIKVFHAQLWCQPSLQGQVYSMKPRTVEGNKVKVLTFSQGGGQRIFSCYFPSEELAIKFGPYYYQNQPGDVLKPEDALNYEQEAKENKTTTPSTNKIPSRTPDTNGDPAAGSTFRPPSEKTYQLGTINADTVNFRFFNQMDDKVLVKGDKLWISTQTTQQTVGGKQQTFRLVGYVKTAEWGWVSEEYIDFVN